MGKAAAAFALRDVNEIMQNKFAIVPGINANDERVTETDATGVFGNDADAFRRLRQFRILRKRNPVYHQHSDPVAILHPGEFGVVGMPRPQWITPRQNEFFLRCCPLISERQ